MPIQPSPIQSPIDLPIDDLIVPASVTRDYLKNYSEEFKGEIEDLYNTIETEALSSYDGQRTPGASVFVLVAGSHGVGKSHLVEKLIEAGRQNYVVCDVDAIITRFPDFKEAVRQASIHAQDDFHGAVYNDQVKVDEHDAMYDAIKNATSRYRNAAKYISDRLMTRCVREGIPVILETSAQTPRIGNFLDNVIKTGAILETHICQAPLSVKQAGSEASYSRNHDIVVSGKQIKAEHHAMVKNMPTIAEKSNGNITLHWRQDVNDSLSPAAIGTKDTFTRDEISHAGFNAVFMDAGVTIEKLMGDRKFLSASAPQVAAAPTFTM